MMRDDLTNSDLATTALKTTGAAALAFDREKRVYKDAYVRNFRRVRYFPGLAAIGAGRSDGESIILVQEAASTSDSDVTTARGASSRPALSLEDVPSRHRLLSPDSVSF